MKKRLISVITAASMVCTMPAGTFAADAESTQGGEITIATVSSTGGLDPAGFALDMWTEYAKLCTDGLVSYDSEGNLIYESAESVDTSDDGLVWTFHLRENQWSDGSDVTAADFVNTIDRALDPNNGNAIYANMLFNISGAEEASESAPQHLLHRYR